MMPAESTRGLKIDSTNLPSPTSPTTTTRPEAIAELGTAQWLPERVTDVLAHVIGNAVISITSCTCVHSEFLDFV